MDGEERMKGNLFFCLCMRQGTFIYEILIFFVYACEKGHLSTKYFLVLIMVDCTQRGYHIILYSFDEVQVIIV